MSLRSIGHARMNRDLLYGKLAEHRLAELSRLQRLSVFAGGDQVQAILAAATIAESYADEVIQVLVVSSGIDSTLFGRTLIRNSEESFFHNWDDRYNWLRDAFQVKISGSRPSQDLRALVELRNAILHGGGRLTKKQVRDVPRMVDLENQLLRVLRVQVEGGALRYVGATDALALRVARSFVLALDAAVRTEHPHLPF